MSFAIFALLMLRIGGTHLHLCFDGAESGVSLHQVDAGHHLEPAQNADHDDHDDRDITLADQMLSKLGKNFGDQPLPTLLLMIAVAVFLPNRRIAGSAPPPTAASPPFSPPPLRAPPQPAS